MARLSRNGGIRCPKCGHPTVVMKTFAGKELPVFGDGTERRRKCPSCNARHSTVEIERELAELLIEFYLNNREKVEP